MRETYIVAAGVNGTEIMKSLAYHGKACFNHRFVSPVELARLALIKSGIIVSETILSPKEQVAQISLLLSGNQYFGEATYADLYQITTAINRIRHLAIDTKDEVLQRALGKGLFREKNETLYEVCSQYLQLLSREKSIDSTALIQKAIQEASALDADIICLREFPLSPLERKLCSVLSQGTYSEKEIRELYNRSQCPIKIAEIKNCYGAANEIESIISEIYSGKNLDACTIAITDTAVYSQLLFDYALQYQIPMTFGCGIPIANSNPAKLLRLYLRWMAESFFSGEMLKTMLTSDVFDRSRLLSGCSDLTAEFPWKTFYEVLSSIRLTNDVECNTTRIQAFRTELKVEAAEISSEDQKGYRDLLYKQKCLPLLEILARELALPVEDFIAVYSKIRKGSKTNIQKMLMRLDQAAVADIQEELYAVRESGAQTHTSDLIANVLGHNVCRMGSSEGAVHVTDIAGALCSIRQNIYVVGLSASKFPGVPRENYLLLDDDLLQFGTDAKYLTSAEVILRKRGNLLSLAHIAADLGCSVFLSYAGMNVSDLKRENASSVIYELFQEKNAGTDVQQKLEDEIHHVGYFDPALSRTREVGKAYTNRIPVLQDEESDSHRTEYTLKCGLDREYSPSALNTFFGCPRRFFLEYVLGIPEPELKDPLEVITAAESGTLAHKLMEQLANSEMNLDEFLGVAEEAFNRFLSTHTPVIPESAAAAKEQFLEMMDSAYRMDKHREVVLMEEDIHCCHETGVKIHGYPDRVEKLEDGQYLVVDFKSARRISHTENDILSCLQVVIYAYLMEKKGLPVQYGEFRYIRLGETVGCKYDEEMKHRLHDMLQEFRTALETGDFPANGEENDACTYCKYSGICKRT